MAEKQTFILGLIGGVGREEHGSYPFERSLRFLCDSDRSYGQEAFGAGEAALNEISALLAWGTF